MTTFIVIVLAGTVILALLGFALLPLMAASGLWAHTSAQSNRDQAQEIDRLLSEPNR